MKLLCRFSPAGLIRFTALLPLPSPKTANLMVLDQPKAQLSVQAFRLGIDHHSLSRKMLFGHNWLPRQHEGFFQEIVHIGGSLCGIAWNARRPMVASRGHPGRHPASTTSKPEKLPPKVSSGGGDGSSSSPPTSDHEVADDFTSFVLKFPFGTFQLVSKLGHFHPSPAHTSADSSFVQGPCSRHHVELDLFFSTLIPFLHHQLHPLNTNPARWSFQNVSQKLVPDPSALALPLCNGCFWSRSLSEGIGKILQSSCCQVAMNLPL